jgi:hypothetical protein
MILLMSVSFFALAEENQSIVGGNPTQRTASLEMNRIMFVDHDLNRTFIKSGGFLFKDRRHDVIRVSVERYGDKRDTGFLEAWVMFRNHTDYVQQIEARVTFFDGDEIPVGDTTAWQRVPLSANSFGTFRELCIDQSAEYFFIEVRQAI